MTARTPGFVGMARAARAVLVVVVLVSLGLLVLIGLRISTSLADLRRLQDRMEQQLGIRLTIAPGPNEVRTLRGITILVHEQRGLCRKTRQSIPAAIRQALERRPEISYELLDEGGLFGGQ